MLKRLNHLHVEHSFKGTPRKKPYLKILSFLLEADLLIRLNNPSEDNSVNIRIMDRRTLKERLLKDLYLQLLL